MPFRDRYAEDFRGGRQVDSVPQQLEATSGDRGAGYHRRGDTWLIPQHVLPVRNNLLNRGLDQGLADCPLRALDYI
jgi:hypothetical protein